MGWMLTFKPEFRELILSGVKTQTTRWNAYLWQERNRRRESGGCHTLSIWIGNPRTGKAEKIGEAEWTDYYSKYGHELTDEEARADGFGNVMELVEALGQINRMTYEEVLGHLWAVIRWRLIEKEVSKNGKV